MSEFNSSISNEGLAVELKKLLDDELAGADKHWSYRKAASVLSFFDMDEIKPFEGAPDKTAARKSLLPTSSIVYDDTRQPHWMLRSDSRRAALKLLGTEDQIKHALELNPHPSGDLLQQTFESYVYHHAKPLENQTRQELLCTFQVAEWLEGLVEDVPAPRTVRQRLEMENLLSSFRFLVGDHFRGREAEITRLAKYVGVTETIYEKIFSLKQKPPLVIYGPGGVGKSTIVAKFILDHVIVSGPGAVNAEVSSVSGHAQRFPFAYLDFDRPSIIAEEPITLLIAALRQLEIQFPESSVSLRRLRESWTERIASRTSRRRHATGTQNAPGTSEPTTARIDRRGLFLDEFAREIKLLTPDDQPLLFVLDTFEEVQFRSRAFVVEVFKFLESLQKRIPTLRTVLSGRAPIKTTEDSKNKLSLQAQKDEFETDDMPLTIFDPEIAQGFLLSHGVDDPEMAKLIAAQVGGSPLTLKLAVELWRREGASTKGLRDLRVRDKFLQRLDDGAIQVQLFTRILEHIHDQKRVAKLAHPGLVLRRITPELILDVLAEPCGVEVRDFDEAVELFNELSKEVALVSQAGDNALVHRADLRRVMLEPLRKDKKKQAKVTQIHQNAIEYYSRFDDDVSRAEEIYHRLWLGIDRPVLMERWREGLPLGSAIEELPVKAKAFLAARLTLDGDEAIWKAADLEDWEIHTARRARDLLEINQPFAALVALRQRKERTSSSPLPVIEREALLGALTTMQNFFSVYTTTLIKRAAMKRLYEAILAGLGEWELPEETIIAVRDMLKLDGPEGQVSGTATSKPEDALPSKKGLFDVLRQLIVKPSNTTSANGQEVERGLRSLIEMLNRSELNKAQSLFGEIHDHLTDLYGEYQKHAVVITE